MDSDIACIGHHVLHVQGDTNGVGRCGIKRVIGLGDLVIELEIKGCKVALGMLKGE